ncbi:MAG: radical SAM protein [Clostridia bacterium]|nr:radical SAM protein [Clostridia bacterium]
MSRPPVWRRIGRYRVSSELFLDAVFTSRCGCACPWCVSRTLVTAPEDRPAWERAVFDAFRLFDIKSVIILGGEATSDPDFFGKTEHLARAMPRDAGTKLILTTNGIALRDENFLDRLLASGIDAVNISRMHHDQETNDRVFGCRTLSAEEIGLIGRRLRDTGRTLRLNVNVWRGNLDSVAEMETFVRCFAGKCDAVKFTPLMATDMFGTVPEVTRISRALAIPENEIAGLWDAFIRAHRLTGRAHEVLGFVDYAETEVVGQRVILKYAQVEDKYDRDRDIPTLKIYPNGCLSNEWNFQKDIRPVF